LHIVLSCIVQLAIVSDLLVTCR